MTSAGRPRSDPLLWHLLLILCVSAAYESLFLHHGINWLDEGWPLHAARQLLAGGILYEDVFFVFPPGHLLPAWIATALDPPGVILARTLYASFNVALVVVLYLLGRRLMPPGHALFAAGLVALAAPRSHLRHYLFGYRYLVFGALALLCYAQRLRSGDHRWMLPAGLLTGIALCFRLTPAFAVGVALLVGVLAADRSPKGWLRDGAWFSAGFVVAVAPVLAWLAGSVGLETVWREVLLRPVAMTDLQSLPVPPLTLPSWDRDALSQWFVAAQFRGYTVLYLICGGVLLALWGRALVRREPFRHALLVAVVTWGGIYFLRAFGRSDQAHLDSTLPPVCLLMGSLISMALRGQWPGQPAWVGRLRRSRVMVTAILAGTFGGWLFLQQTDRYLSPSVRGLRMLESLPIGVSTGRGVEVDRRALQIRDWTTPDQQILDVSASPLLHVLADRDGPGSRDLIMPGTFLDAQEEIDFLARIQANPPALVVRSLWGFDADPARSVGHTAPRLARWIKEHYRQRGLHGFYVMLVPDDPLPGSTAQ